VNTRRASPARGLTLIELMVGVAVGLFVAVVAISLFSSTRTLAKVGGESTRMSENARLAMDMLHKDVRSAGFQGCAPEDGTGKIAPISTLNAHSAFLDPGTSGGIAGYHGTGGGFSPALPAALSGLGASDGSDVLSVRVPVEPTSFGLTAKVLQTGNPQVGAGTIPANTIVSGSIVLLANCKAGAMFQVTEANPSSTGSLSHIVGGSFVPGNNTADMQQAFTGDSAVYQIETHHYFIAPAPATSARAGTLSLWRYTFPPPAGKADPFVEEMAAGIEKMVVSYGVAKIGSNPPLDRRNVSRYVSAENVPDWNLVVAVRLQLIASTPTNGMSRTFQTFMFAGSSVTATDKRLHSVLTEVVTLRNRAQ
jgi:type IV pilus assembly protein PilW